VSIESCFERLGGVDALMRDIIARTLEFAYKQVSVCF